MTKPFFPGSTASVCNRPALMKSIMLAIVIASAAAAQITPGNLVVLRVGDGSAVLSSAATPVFLEEYLPAGGLPVQTIALPSTGLTAITNSGSATSEGFLNLSADGQYLVHGGYRAAAGTAGVVAGSSVRVISRVGINGTVDTSTGLTDAYLGNNLRSVASADGLEFWTGGTASTTGGVRFVAGLGATTTTQLSTTVTNVRVVNIANNQLYTSSASGALQGVSTVGTGLPVTPGQVVTILPGFPITSGPSAYDYFFADASTLYVADDRSSVAGGIQKWTLAAGTWTLQYTLNPATNIGCRGITGVVNSGVTTLFATTSHGTLNQIVSVTDAGPSSTFTTLAIAGTNKAFRGIRYIPSNCTGPAITPGGNPQPATACAGSPASFTVNATGSATLTYQWRKDTNPLLGQNAPTLAFAAVSPTDAGAYDCVITNGCGTTTSAAASLTVNVAPSISVDPSPVTTCDGTPASFTVTASGTPAPTYQWRKDTNPIMGEVSATLSFAAVSSTDAGSYDCVVTNSCGSVTSLAATLVVDSAPTVTSPPSPVTICEGQPASFTVGATGTATLTYQWRKDTNPIMGETSPTLSFAAVSSTDAGSYDCVVTNGCGSVTSSAAALVVDQAPTVGAPSGPTTACEGTPASFTVSASGTPTLGFQWRKDSNPISGEISPTLLIPAVTTGDAASYDCVVTNGCGSATSPAIALTVSTPPTVNPLPANLVVVAGMPVTLTVTATGTPTLTYLWRKDGTPLPSETNASLAFVAATYADAGSYDCEVTNGCATVTSTATALAVIPANDDCFTASPIAAGLVMGDNTTATTEPGLPALCTATSRDVWYSFTNALGCPTDVTLSLCASDGGTANFDATLAVFTGACGTLNAVACDATSCSGAARLSFTAAPGTTFLVAVSATGTGSGGQFTLAVLSHNAVSQTYGASCPPSAGTLSGGLPLLGQVGCLSLTGSTPNSAGLLLYSGAVSPPFGSFGGCPLYVDPVGIGIFLVINTDAAGAWTFCSLIPGMPELQCLDVRFQAIMLPLGGFALTNGLRLVLGN